MEQSLNWPGACKVQGATGCCASPSSLTHPLQQAAPYSGLQRRGRRGRCQCLPGTLPAAAGLAAARPGCPVDDLLTCSQALAGAPTPLERGGLGGLQGLAMRHPSVGLLLGPRFHFLLPLLSLFSLSLHNRQLLAGVAVQRLFCSLVLLLHPSLILSFALLALYPAQR